MYKLTVILRFGSAFSLFGSFIFYLLIVMFTLIGDDNLIIYWSRTSTALLIISICLWLISRVIGKDALPESE